MEGSPGEEPARTRASLIEAYAAAFEASPAGLIQVDGQGAITLFNRGAEAMFGYSREEVLGRSVELLVPERYRGVHAGDRTGFMADPSTRVMGAGRDLFALHKDGAEFAVEIGLNPVETSDGLQVVSSIVDITERKRAEARLKRTATELARSNEDLEQFAYAASHDMQEPLRMITGFLQLLEQHVGQQLDEKARQYIGFAVDGAERMRTLIDDLLAFSRVQTRREEKRPVDLGATVRSAAANLRLSFEEARAELSVAELPSVTADAGQMTLLFQNLLSNAVRFRSEDPPRIEVTPLATDEGHVEVAVTDNGIGIEPRYVERIFGMFQRLHSREEYPGSGIGLTICRRVAERHGGTVRVHSTPGKGSSFIVRLPRTTLPSVPSER